MAQTIEPITAFSYVEMPQQLPFVDVDFDMVLREAAVGLQPIGQNATISQMMPGVSGADRKVVGTAGLGANVGNVIYAMQTATYANAVTSLASSVAQTIKTLLRGG